MVSNAQTHFVLHLPQLFFMVFYACVKIIKRCR